MTAKDSITKELYDAFQKLELDRWDAIVAQDVLINSPAGRDLRGLEILKSWGGNSVGASLIKSTSSTSTSPSTIGARDEGSSRSTSTGSMRKTRSD
jgi:hypothetical protein